MIATSAVYYCKKKKKFMLCWRLSLGLRAWSDCLSRLHWILNWPTGTILVPALLGFQVSRDLTKKWHYQRAPIDLGLVKTYFMETKTLMVLSRTTKWHASRIGLGKAGQWIVTRRGRKPETDGSRLKGNQSRVERSGKNLLESLACKMTKMKTKKILWLMRRTAGAEEVWKCCKCFFIY